jgi:iron complex transport system ATP-binding protein
LTYLAKRTLQEISGGEKQLATFGRVIAQGTPILLLDEITSDLDIKNTLKVIKVLTDMKTNHTIIVSTHDPQIAEAIADTLVLFKPNQVINYGPPNRLLTAQNLSDTYQIPQSAIQENPIQIQWNKKKA